MHDTVQNLRAFSQKVFDLVEEFISNNQFILSDGEGVYVNVKNEVTIIPETETRDKANFYPIRTLVRDGDNGLPEADGDAIDKIANRYFFVR